jgi:hypothetical protein
MVDRRTSSGDGVIGWRGMKERWGNECVKLIEEPDLEPEDVVWTGGAGAGVLCGVDRV